jgi:hypothetical protein
MRQSVWTDHLLRSVVALALQEVPPADRVEHVSFTDAVAGRPVQVQCTSAALDRFDGVSLSHAEAGVDMLGARFPRRVVQVLIQRQRLIHEGKRLFNTPEMRVDLRENTAQAGLGPDVSEPLGGLQPRPQDVRQLVKAPPVKVVAKRPGQLPAVHVETPACRVINGRDQSGPLGGEPGPGREGVVHPNWRDARCRRGEADGVASRGDRPVGRVGRVQVEVQQPADRRRSIFVWVFVLSRTRPMSSP